MLQLLFFKTLRAFQSDCWLWCSESIVSKIRKQQGFCMSSNHLKPASALVGGVLSLGILGISCDLHLSHQSPTFAVLHWKQGQRMTKSQLVISFCWNQISVEGWMTLDVCNFACEDSSQEDLLTVSEEDLLTFSWSFCFYVFSFFFCFSEARLQISFCTISFWFYWFYWFFSIILRVVQWRCLSTSFMTRWYQMHSDKAF